jgi:hypothetical protein
VKGANCEEWNYLVCSDFFPLRFKYSHQIFQMLICFRKPSICRKFEISPVQRVQVSRKFPPRYLMMEVQSVSEIYDLKILTWQYQEIIIMFVTTNHCQGYYDLPSVCLLPSGWKLSFLTTLNKQMTFLYTWIFTLLIEDGIHKTAKWVFNIINYEGRREKVIFIILNCY